MSDFLAEHWVLSIVLTILLGALGSGLWDAFLKPIAIKIGAIIFKLFTFGAQKANDKIYKDAAKRHHEKPSLYLLLILFLFLIIYLFTTQIELYSKIYGNKGSALDDISIVISKKCTQKDDKKYFECAKSKLKEELAPKLIFALLLSIFIAVIAAFNFLSIALVNFSITLYCQCLHSIRPYIEDSQLYLIEQKFSLMSSKKDFDEIIDELKEIASTNKIELPLSNT